MTHVPSNATPEATSVAPYKRLFVVALRVMVGAFAATSLAVAASTYHRTGLHNPVVGGLLFNPGDRFRDLTNALEGISAGNPYARFTTSLGAVFPYGNPYPPAHVALLRPLNFIPTDGAITIVALALAVAILLLVQVAVPSRHAFWSSDRGIARHRPLSFYLIALPAIPVVLIVKSELEYYALVLALCSTAAFALTFAPNRFRFRTIQLSLTLLFAACYPVVFALDRMNVDIIVLFLLTLGVTTALRGRPITSGVIIGVATAFKLYPIVFLLIMLIRMPRKLKFAVATMVSAIVATVVGMRLIGVASEQIQVGFTAGLKWFEEAYALGPLGSNYSASLFNGIVTSVYAREGTFPIIFAQDLYSWWGPLQIGVIVSVLAIGILGRYQDWAQWMLACTAIIAFIPATSEYRLVLLLIPIALWLRHLAAPSDNDLRMRGLHIVLAALLGFALAPKAILAPLLGFITLDSLVTPWSLLAVLLVSLILGWCTRRRRQCAV